ncbi:MAG: hypothetical protein HY918_02535 [Candidatus Doudnabacteria bacterium]|nr:hypothetical protein [Candidatus Doudnabacteria bacterium]
MDEIKQNLWVANPKLKILLLVFIFIFLFSGVGLVVFAQMQNSYRQQIYQETVDSLPKHQAGASENQSVGESDVSNWKTYKNDQYGFELKYPQDWASPIDNSQNIELGCPRVESEAGPRCPLQIEVSTKKSKSDYIKTLQLTAFKDSDKIINQKGSDIIASVVNNVDAITYRDAGMCTYTHTVFFGSNQIFSFVDNCEHYQNNGVYAKIAATFKFTK